MLTLEVVVHWAASPVGKQVSVIRATVVVVVVVAAHANVGMQLTVEDNVVDDPAVDHANNPE